jgi:hypothetical protein
MQMDQPNPLNESGNKKPERPPWWVRLVIPVETTPRRYVMRNFWFYIVAGLLLGICFGARAFLSEDWYPYRWWVVAYLVVVVFFLVLEWLAIRWKDRFQKWPPS